MKIGFVIFNQMTSLDFIGIYDPLTRLKSMGFVKDLAWDICAYTHSVTDDRGLMFSPGSIAAPLDVYDMVVLPGGMGTRMLVQNASFVQWLHTARDCRWKVSVCTGSLLWAATGILKGRKATTHPNAYQELLQMGVEVVRDRRIVDEGDIITCRGVSAGLDLGLYLVEKIAGADVRQQISDQMDYPYYPL